MTPEALLAGGTPVITRSNPYGELCGRDLALTLSDQWLCLSAGVFYVPEDKLRWSEIWNVRHPPTPVEVGARIFSTRYTTRSIPLDDVEDESPWALGSLAAFCAGIPVEAIHRHYPSENVYEKMQAELSLVANTPTFRRWAINPTPNSPFGIRRQLEIGANLTGARPEVDVWRVYSPTTLHRSIRMVCYGTTAEVRFPAVSPGPRYPELTYGIFDILRKRSYFQRLRLVPLAEWEGAGDVWDRQKNTRMRDNRDARTWARAWRDKMRDLVQHADIDAALDAEINARIHQKLLDEKQRGVIP